MKEVFFNNIKFLIGESAQDNWNILKLCKSDHIWFHLDKQSSPYVIICESEKNLKKQDVPHKRYIDHAAMLCKENSKMKNSYRTRVMYTEIRNISKGKKVGSVLVKKKANVIVL
jgi:predicted ribosome quality control (RQC) complex YloA/Tae2 family protein